MVKLLRGSERLLAKAHVMNINRRISLAAKISLATSAKIQRASTHAICIQKKRIYNGL